MPSGLFLGLLILCCSPLLLLAGQCPRYFTCQGLSDDVFSFPLTNTSNPECGLLVRGCGDPDAAVEIRLGNENQRWLEIHGIIQETFSSSTSLSVKDRKLDEILSTKSCNLSDYNFTLPPASPIMSFENIFDYTFTVCKCNNDVSPAKTFGFQEIDCDFLGVDYDHHLYVGNLSGRRVPTSFNACTISHIPAAISSTNGSELEASAEYTMKVTLSEECGQCFDGGGQCRLDSEGKFRCVSEGLGREFANVLMVAIAASAATVAVLVVLNCYLRRKVTSASIFFWKGENPTHQTIEEFLKRHETTILTKRYTYSEIREMTSSFKNKLGQGGYGSVYKGRLPDGRLVAVKILSELKGNGEEFINEVASISQTSHVNVVSLFGFCFQGSKRALVYEFMPNGSLEKFIYGDNASMVDRQLDCQTLHDIAIGTARGLEYLHKGCNTRILHFDIKPHNILLDVDFCPKISDFGLSKICPRKESIVSMLGARGTAGYIAPEVFSRNFGGVSHKSDVYSFGMMVLEMVGGRKNINVEVERSSELYFPNWIYKCLESNQELALRCIKNENDNEMVRKMIVVSLWCIQTDPSTRPAMSKVVDMLEGSIKSLQIPPKPFLSSPQKSPARDSTSSMSDLLCD